LGNQLCQSYGFDGMVGLSITENPGDLEALVKLTGMMTICLVSNDSVTSVDDSGLGQWFGIDAVWVESG